MKNSSAGPPRSTPDTAAVREALLEDTLNSFIAVANDPTQTNRRNYVRAVFAYVEGFLSVMKDGALAEHEAGRHPLSWTEIAAILEESYDVRDDGEVRTRPAFVPAKANLRFAFDVFARAHGIASGPDYGGAGWSRFQEALQVRNRVTHPKASSDITVSDNELQVVKEAHSWFLGASFDVFVQGRANLIAKTTAAGIPLPELKYKA